MLAHHATMQEVPFELGQLLDEPFGDPYMEALGLVVERVADHRKRLHDEAEARMSAGR